MQMEKPLVSILNTVGLILSLVGVVLLFRYGMPYEVRTGGEIRLILQSQDQDQIKLERRYDLLGGIGLFSIVVGTIFQIIATWV